jgi:preprotein translocase subunit SecG
MVTLIRSLLGLMLVLTSLFLILLVLIQRGRGGGLTGALGGAGGQSAFGTKAGDVFTRITVGVAAFWIGLCIVAINVLGRQQSLFSPGLGGAAPQAVAPQTPPAAAPEESSGGSAPAGDAVAPVEPPAVAPAEASPAVPSPSEPAAPAPE